MAKESFSLKSFDKGLTTQVDARDLDNDSVFMSDGISFSISGKVQLLGDGFEDALEGIGWNPFSTFPQAVFINKYDEVLSFKYDYDVGMETEYTPFDSGSGYKSPPILREDGVTYYVAKTGETRNQIIIIANWIDENGTNIFSTIGPDNTNWNSLPSTDSAYWAANNDFYVDFSGQEREMKVGPDEDAEIAGYWVDGGFRYCDANFKNENNNIVGYAGHIKRRYLTNLSSLRMPNPSEETQNLSWARNCWHFSDYQHSHGASDNNYTYGMYNFQHGVFLHGKDGATNWDKLTSNQNFPNYKFWMHIAPNREAFNDDTNLWDWSYNAGGEAGHKHDATMPPGHELRKRWIFGVTTLYDGDPQGTCQETSIAMLRAVENGTATDMDSYVPFILDLKNKLGGSDVQEDSDGGTYTSMATADFDEFPKLYFSWTFMPWWQDGQGNEISSGGTSWSDLDNHLGSNKPPYDARVVGFRIYMKDLDDGEGNWWNLATIDALRGVINYEGCSVEQHRWVPRGYNDNTLVRLENDHPENGSEVRIVNSWSNWTTGRSQIIATHNGAECKWEDYNNFHSTGDGVDPLIDSLCPQSVNIESIPDITYETLNGYKPAYSPTCTNYRWHDFWSGIIEPEYSDDEHSEVTNGQNWTAMQRTFGDVFRFKSATVMNNRVYIGNVFNIRTRDQFPDRILKSEMGQYDIFPDDGFHNIDIASGDGDSIIHLENYNGKLFVFKGNVLYIIKEDDEGSEKVESTHYHYGIDDKHHVVKTKYGIAWFNEGGVYLYDMEGKIHNLITNKLNRGHYIGDMYDVDYVIDLIDSGFVSFILGDLGGTFPQLWDINDDGNIDVMDIIAYVRDYLEGNSNDMAYFYVSQIQYGWKGFVGDDGKGGKPKPMIGYLQQEDKLIIFKSAIPSGLSATSGDAYIYDFSMKNWAFGRKLFPHSGSMFKSNFVNDAKGNLVYMASNPDFGQIEEDGTKFHKWTDTPTKKKNMLFVTKDMDFESPGIRKKVYKVYVTFSSIETPNVKVLYAINGSKRFKVYNSFQTGQNYTSTHGFVVSDDYQARNDRWNTAILKPTTDSEADSLNNIYSIQLMFVNAGGATGDGHEIGPVTSSFQINDISIIYRPKSVK